MRTIVVVNGAYDWSTHFPGHRVVQIHVARSRWLFQDDRLWIQDAQGTHRPDVILWRLGAVRPDPMHRTCLELIRLAGVPCVNPASVLLAGYDRLGMLATLRSMGLPVISFDAVVGPDGLDQISPRFPTVLKVGNLHGGLGKALARDADAFAELSTLGHISGDYITCEPYIDYVRDVRCLAVGDQMWAMERRSETWRANVATSDYRIIAVPKQPGAFTRHAMQEFGADMLGLDFLERQDGTFVLLESNDIPGVLGFPNEVRQAIALQVINKL